MSRTVGALVTKATMRIVPPHLVHTIGTLRRCGRTPAPRYSGGTAIDRFGGGWIGRRCRRCSRRCQREGGASGPPKNSTVLPLRHVARVVADKQAACTKAHNSRRRTRSCTAVMALIEPGHRMDDDPARGGAIECAVDAHVVEVQVRFGRGTEAVDEDHRAKAGRRTRTWIVHTQTWLHRAQEQPARRPLKFGIAVEAVVQALEHHQHQLPHRQARQDVIGEMGRRRHARGVARLADTASLARERDQEAVPALPTPGRNGGPECRTQGNGGIRARDSDWTIQHSIASISDCVRFSQHNVGAMSWRQTKCNSLRW